MPLTCAVVGAVLVLGTSCSPDEECGGDYRGGGEFTVTLAGDVTGKVTGRGSTVEELEAYVDNTQAWFEYQQALDRVGTSGGFCTANMDAAPCQTGFAGWTPVPEGALEGEITGPFLGVHVGSDFIGVSIFGRNDPGRTADANGAEIVRGLDGRASGSSTESLNLEIEVEWSVREDVLFEERFQQCGGGVILF